MSDSCKKTKNFGKSDKGVSLVLMIIAAVLAVVFIVGTLVIVIGQKTVVNGDSLRNWAIIWSGKILGVEQSYATVCGITLGLGLFFIGGFF